MVIFLKNKKVLAVIIVAVFLLFFLAPVIRTVIPGFVLAGYDNACAGRGYESQVYVSISYILFHPSDSVWGQFGLVYTPAGVPQVHNGSMMFFPPLGMNSYSICA